MDNELKLTDILDEMKEICGVWCELDGKIKGYTQNEMNLIFSYITKLENENISLKQRLKLISNYCKD